MSVSVDRYPKGSFPPFITYSEAISFAERIYEQGGGRASYDLLSRVFANSSKSSSFTKKLAALKAYGLATEASKGEVHLSNIGMSIAAPQSPQVEAEARKEAFLKIEPFAKIYHRHKGKLLPADEFLRNIFEQDSSVPKDLSPLWVVAFKEAIRATGLLFDRGDQKTQIMETATFSAAVLTHPESDNILVAQNQNVESQSIPKSPEPVAGSGLNVSLELSNGKAARFFIPDKLQSKDAQKLKSALEGFAALIDSLVSE